MNWLATSIMAARHHSLLFLLIFSPIAYGTVDTLPLALIQAACFLGLLLCGMDQWAAKGPRPNLPPGSLPLLLLLGYVLLQTLPLPMDVLQVLSPTAAALHKPLTGNWGDAAPWAPLSVNVRATITQFFHYASLAGCYLLVVFLTRDGARCQKIILLLTVVGGLIAVQGMLQHWLDNGRLLWVRLPPLNAKHYTGAFVHRNQFAAYLSMLAPLAFSFFLYHQRAAGKNTSFLRHYLGFFVHSNRGGVLYGLATLVLTAACVMGNSRGGILATIGGIGMVMLLHSNQVGWRRTLPWIFVLGVGMILVLGSDVLDQTFTRFLVHDKNLTQISSGRLDIWKECIPIVKDFLVFGSGLGTFGNIFPSYATFPIYPGYFVYHPHNVYLEVFTDLGVIGFILLVCFFLSVFRAAYIGFRRRRDPFARCLFLGAAAGVASQLFQLVFEYNLQSGAVGLMFFTLLALMVSGGHTSFHGTRSSTPLARSGSLGGRMLTAVSGLLLMGSLYWNISTLRAASVFNNSETWSVDLPHERLTELLAQAQTAAHIIPLHSYYHFAQAEIAALLKHRETAEQAYVHAIALNPAQPAYLEGYARYLSALDRKAEAKKSLLSALAHAQADPRIHERCGAWFLSIGDRKTALELYGRSMQLKPSTSKTIIQQLSLASFSLTEISSCLPDRVQAHLAMGQYLEQMGRIDEAKLFFIDARKLITYEKRIHGYFFLTPHRFFKKHHMEADDLQTLLLGIKALPNNVQLHLELARLYERQGDVQAALVNYRKVLELKPGQSHASQRLRRLKGATEKRKLQSTE